MAQIEDKNVRGGINQGNYQVTSQLLHNDHMCYLKKERQKKKEKKRSTSTFRCDVLEATSIKGTRLN